MRRYYILLYTGVLTGILAACSNDKEKSKEKVQVDSVKVNTGTGTPPDSNQNTPAARGISFSRDSILSNAKAIVAYISSRDFEKVSEYVSPSRGLRFSMQSYILPGEQVFFPAGVAGLWTNPKKYKWGEDEAGEMTGTFRDYYARYVYNKDFAVKSEIGFNKVLRGGSNCMVNTGKIYSEFIHVDFFIPSVLPDTELDWSTLRLVFTQENGNWYLRHIIHDHWCI
jgi:hypothetical protein